MFHGRLAELEAEQMSADEALSSIDRAIELARAGDIRYLDALLHRIRGDILLRRDPTNVVPAEDAYLTAIAVAREQGARSFGLLAALSLAKLYQSTGRPIDAHDVLGPALAGFSPTPEFPQIAEAKALFEALAADETVKADAARRAQRVKLQTSYGQAVMWSKGFAAEETKAAFARAENSRRRLAMQRRRSTPITLGGGTLFFAASLARPGRRPKASCEKRNARGGRRRQGSGIAF